jgi:hypothetical protein
MCVPHRVVIIQDANITQKYQELLRKLETMGGYKLGRHAVHCRLFNRKTVTGARVSCSTVSLPTRR